MTKYKIITKILKGYNFLKMYFFVYLQKRNNNNKSKEIDKNS